MATGKATVAFPVSVVIYSLPGFYDAATETRAARNRFGQHHRMLYLKNKLKHKKNAFSFSRCSRSIHSRLLLFFESSTLARLKKKEFRALLYRSWTLMKRRVVIPGAIKRAQRQVRSAAKTKRWRIFTQKKRIKRKTTWR